MSQSSSLISLLWLYCLMSNWISQHETADLNLGEVEWQTSLPKVFLAADPQTIMSSLEKVNSSSLDWHKLCFIQIVMYQGGWQNSTNKFHQIWLYCYKKNWASSALACWSFVTMVNFYSHILIFMIRKRTSVLERLIPIDTNRDIFLDAAICCSTSRNPKE